MFESERDVVVEDIGDGNAFVEELFNLVSFGDSVWFLVIVKESSGEYDELIGLFESEVYVDFVLVSFDDLSLPIGDDW